jgi:succinate dehydrogenase / fumarate reductase, iron-sulfur subunit
MGDTINLKLRIWRQPGPDSAGKLVDYDLPDVSVHSSFLEMMDQLNRNLTERGEEMVEFDSDCREGICGMCGLVIDGIAHGPVDTTTCQLHMREFKDGETITIEPWRAGPFPVIKDLVVDRTAFDRIIAAGGFVSVGTGGAPDANALPVGKEAANEAMNAATCIGCGACVAACPNGSAALFVGAKLSHLALLPQGEPERVRRAHNLIQRMDSEGFGNCSNHGECEAVCPKQIPIRFIAKMKREWLRAIVKGS